MPSVLYAERVRIPADCAPTVLRLCSDCAPTVLRLCSDCAPTVLRLCSDCAPTGLCALCQYCASTVPVLCQYCAYASEVRPSRLAARPQSQRREMTRDAMTGRLHRFCVSTGNRQPSMKKGGSSSMPKHVQAPNIWKHSSGRWEGDKCRPRPRMQILGTTLQ